MCIRDRYVHPIVVAYAAAGQHVNDLTVASVGMQADGGPRGQGQCQDTAHAVGNGGADVGFAGAAKIGAMARTLLGAPPVRAAIHLYGSFAETGAGHGTDRALVGGLLGMKPDDPRLPDAFAEAEKAGLTYTIDEIKLRDAHPNTAVIEAKSADGRTLTMQASSIGGGRIMVNKLDGIDVNFNGMFNTLVIRNQDASGTVAAITSILSQLRVNVANMSLYRHKRGGDALMVIELDQHLKPSQVAFLSELPGVLSMTYYDKEEDDDGSGFDEGNI